MAHPLYGEVRRKRAAPTRLRRLRGLVATELAAGDNRDEVRVVVRRAALSLDSDLEPDADLLLRAAQGAICLADLPLADRLAEAAVRAGAGPEASSPAHMRCRGSAGARKPKRCSPRLPHRTDRQEHARFTYLRASNMLWALADPARAKEIIDDASRVTTGAGASCIDAVLDGVLVCDRPPGCGDRNVTEPGVGRPACHRRCRDSLGARRHLHADAGHTSDAVAIADAGYTVATRCFDAPHMRFNIADAHVGALLLSGRVADALEVAERERQQAADLPGRGPVSRCCRRGSGRPWCRPPRHRMFAAGKAAGALSASGHAIGWGFRYHVPHATALAMRGCTRRGSRHAGRARQAATSFPVTGL